MSVKIKKKGWFNFTLSSTFIISLSFTPFFSNITSAFQCKLHSGIHCCVNSHSSLHWMHPWLKPAAQESIWGFVLRWCLSWRSSPAAADDVSPELKHRRGRALRNSWSLSELKMGTDTSNCKKIRIKKAERSLDKGLKIMGGSNEDQIIYQTRMRKHFSPKSP